MFAIEKSNKEELLDEGSEEAVLRHRQESFDTVKAYLLNYAVKLIIY
jgi:hypothetical protein